VKPVDINIASLDVSIEDTPFVANLRAALERKTNIALILGLVDDINAIRSMYGLVSCDEGLQALEGMFHERFGYCSLRAYEIFLVLVTGDEAAKATEIAESIRTAVENQEGLVVPSLAAEPIESLTLAERVHMTMHFGVTSASSHWTRANGFNELVKAAQEAINEGRRRLVANRVFCVEEIR
jgi:GGDEF domain-containing protein